MIGCHALETPAVVVLESELTITGPKSQRPGLLPLRGLGQGVQPWGGVGA